MRPQPLLVATLIGEKYVDLAITCLASMAEMSLDPLRFSIHDDGSLTNASRQRLRGALPVDRIVARDDADMQIDAALSEYPACRSFRERFAYGIKLFDLPTLHPGQTVAFVDCDVFFLKPFSGLFRFPDGVDCIFMQDSQNAYSLRPWHMVGSRAIRVPRRLNGGMFCYRKSAFDLRLLEDVIARPYAVYTKSLWLEQTCFGALAASVSSALWSARQVVVPSGVDELHKDLVAAHLTSSVRGLLPDAIRRRSRDVPAVVIETVPARPLGAAAFAMSEIRRAVKRRLA